jgi:hypothetical protein
MDFSVSNHGSIFLLQPHAFAARAWVEQHVDPDHQEWAGGVVVGVMKNALGIKVRQVKAALEGLEAKSEASQIEPVDVRAVLELVYELETVDVLSNLEQRLKLLEASALRHRGGPLFTEIHELRTEVLTALGRERGGLLSPEQYESVAAISSRIAGRAGGQVNELPDRIDPRGGR